MLEIWGIEDIKRKGGEEKRNRKSEEGSWWVGRIVEILEDG